MLITTLIILLSLFIATGWFASRQTKASSRDYLLANQQVSPALTALSAAASKYSGYMFVGLIGFIYTKGLLAIWVIIGFVLGDLLTWWIAVKRLHLTSQQPQIMSYAGLLSHWHGQNNRYLCQLIALISLFFLTLYAAAQLSAAGKTLFAIFDLSYQWCVILTAILIGTYCINGGLRASIWTDALQAILMIAGLITTISLCLTQIGGFTALINQLELSEPKHLTLSSDIVNGFWPLLLFALGWLFNGIGTLGQPHIVVRYMALAKQASIKQTAAIYFAWSLSFVCLILLTGLLCRALLPITSMTDPELALPQLAIEFLPPSVIGLVIVAMLSSILSTADSQILSCSAVLSEDFKLANSHKKRLIATSIILIIATLISLFALANVFTLVVFAWAALASGFTPLLLILIMGQKPSQRLAITMVLMGIGVSLAWRLAGLSSQIYEAMPGILAGIAVFIAAAVVKQLSSHSRQH